MNSYLALSTTQVLITLVSSLVFTCLGIYYQKSEYKKNSLVNVWFLISVILGFYTFIIGYTLSITTLSVGATEPTTAIIVFWYTLIFFCFFQFTSFLTAFGLNLYFAHNHSSCSVVGEGVRLFNDTDLGEGVYKVNFTWKRFLLTFGVWLGLTLVIGGMVYGIAYFVSA